MPKADAKPALELPGHTEYWRCNCCDSVIPRDHVLISPMHNNGARPLSRTIKAWCEACGRVIEVDNVLEGGQWSAVDVPRYPEGRQRDAIIARLEEKLGVIQLARKSA
jgi:hypothetical protein